MQNTFAGAAFVSSVFVCSEIFMYALIIGKLYYSEYFKRTLFIATYIRSEHLRVFLSKSTSIDFVLAHLTYIKAIPKPTA